jgi:predicted kinase
VKLYILRGLSGSGKSTYADYLKRTNDEVLICSADAELDHGHGYQFDSRRLPDAHKYCLRRFIDGVQKRWAVVVLDNTNILYHHFSHYIVIAEAFDYEVEIVTILASPEDCAERTTHDVALKSLKSRSKALSDDRSRVTLPVRLKQRVVNAGSATWRQWKA